MKKGIWRLWGLKCGVRTGTIALCRSEENAILNCPDKQRWRDKFTEKKCLMIKKMTAFKTVVGCTKTFGHILM